MHSISLFSHLRHTIFPYSRQGSWGKGIQKIDSIKEISNQLLQSSKRDLIVWDVDDVLFTPSDKVLQPGYPFFPHPLDKIKQLSSPRKEKMMSRIYTQTKMQLIESEFLNLFWQLKQKEIKTLALTAFETPSFGIIQDTVEKRLQELNSFGFDFSSSFPNYSCFHLEEGFPSRSPFFKKGVLFSAPHAKGNVLNAFLEHISYSPSQLWVIDDCEKNLHSILKSVKLKGRIHCLHYRGAEHLPKSTDREMGLFQVNHLLKTGAWLSDTTLKREEENVAFSAVFDLLSDQKLQSIPTVITPYHWPDIDGIACTQAFVELLKKIGFQRVRGAISQTPQKEPLWIMQKLGFSFPQIETTSEDQIFLVDVSDHQDLPSSLVLQHIRLVIDHRQYTDLSRMPHALPWIEKVGSAATMIYQLYKKFKIIPTPLSAKLLYAAIMSNTICCKTRNTTFDDISAAKELQKIGHIDESFIHEMFEAKSDLSQTSLFQQLDEDLSSKLQKIAGENTAIAQLEITHVEKLLQERKEEILDVLTQLQKLRHAEQIFLVAIDLLGGQSFFVFLSKKMEKCVVDSLRLEKKQGFWFSSDTLTRKDVIHTLQENS